MGAMRRKIKLVIVDFSGVLVDDLRVSCFVISKIVLHHGKTADNLRQFIWRFRLPYWKYLIDKKFAEEVAKNDKRIPMMFVQLYKKMMNTIRLFPEVKEVFKSLSKKSVKIVIVSHTPRELIKHILTKHGIINYFDDYLGYGDYKRDKPEPDSILAVLKRFKVKPSEAVYIGDMREDMIAAKRAGVMPIAISRRGSYHPITYLKKQNPAMLIKNLRELLIIVQ